MNSTPELDVYVHWDTAGESKLHVAQIGVAMLHADHRYPSVSYESVIRLTRQLTGDQRDCTEMFRRAVFNVVAHNRDDHTKNVSFLMDRTGSWRLAPAYDLTWAYGPGGEHTMTVNGRGDDITRADLLVLGEAAGLSRGKADAIIQVVSAAVSEWPTVARDNNVQPMRITEIGSDHHLKL